LVLQAVHVDPSLHAAQLASHATQGFGSAELSAKTPTPQLPLVTQSPSLLRK
jgi:hypothetical protein